MAAAVIGAGVVAIRLLVPVRIEPIAIIDIAPGTSTGRVAQQLQERGLIRDDWAFVALARLSGRDREIRHGRHFFGGRMDAEAILAELVSPPRLTRRVTIQEGLTIAEAGKVLEKQGFCKAQDYVDAACAAEFLTLAGAGEHAHCSEGFLFPDTYQLTPGMSADRIVRLQLARFREVLGKLTTESDWVEATAGPQARTRHIELTAQQRRDLVVLASIIQKEAYDRSEQPLVSSVFHNRMRRGMKLQADPTVIYGLMLEGRWHGNITRAHLRESTPYNTYVHDGLPPGPICNPGASALDAALHPSTSDFLYFVAQGDGSHRFSRTLAEHNRAVRRLQLHR